MGQKQHKKIVRVSSAVGSVGVVIVLFLVFIIAVKWFRAEPIPEEEVVSSIVDVLKPDPISQAVIDGAIDTVSRDAELYWKSSNARVGSASRGEKDGKYYVEMKMTLPEIDREVHYYQVWLLRRLPYEFFSLGEMTTDEDGYFVIEWQAPDTEDYSGYGHIIVTVNAYDGDAGPGTHKVIGEFGG
ncbi:hypothetical protein HQ487_00320 [Candidatus Uhrbacteria bacterium]|nr:hypothetical protein [Candidatus Uhrbacteria bacterium]